MEKEHISSLAGESWGELGRAGESWGEVGRRGECWGVTGDNVWRENKVRRVRYDGVREHARTGERERRRRESKKEKRKKEKREIQ